MSFFFLIMVMSFKYSKAQMVPAMFVFGDSSVDVGNNNYLPLSIARADFPFNGIDFPTRKPTGRFSNGKNAADFLGKFKKIESSSAWKDHLHLQGFWIKYTVDPSLYYFLYFFLHIKNLFKTTSVSRVPLAGDQINLTGS